MSAGGETRVFPVKRCVQPVLSVERIRSAPVFQLRHDDRGALVSPAAAVAGAPTDRPAHRQSPGELDPLPVIRFKIKHAVAECC